jgi:transcriptional regulator with XRE-family HTH domain
MARPIPTYDQFRRLLVETRQGRGITQTELARRLGKPQSFVSKYELGERRLDLIEFIQISRALGADPTEWLGRLLNPGRPHPTPSGEPTILERWNINAQELTKVVRENPSLRGLLLGYTAELKFEELLRGDPRVSYISKSDDHDRKKKGDRVIWYKDRELIIEVKGLQTNSIKKGEKGWSGKVQVDASDRREVELPDGSRVNTTCLLAGEFDLLAVNLFAFEEEWRFIFARNQDLPRSNFKNYTEAQRKWLLATLVEVTWPPRPPFHEDLFRVLDELARARKARTF